MSGVNINVCYATDLSGKKVIFEHVAVQKSLKNLRD